MSSLPTPARGRYQDRLRDSTVVLLPSSGAPSPADHVARVERRRWAPTPPIAEVGRGGDDAHAVEQSSSRGGRAIENKRVEPRESCLRVHEFSQGSADFSGGVAVRSKDGKLDWITAWCDTVTMHGEDGHEALEMPMGSSAETTADLLESDLATMSLPPTRADDAAPADGTASIAPVGGASLGGGVSVAELCRRSVLNCEIPSDIDALRILHQRFEWTPSDEMIRPTDEVRASKDIFVTQTLAQFSSVTDQVLHDVFGCPVMETPAGRVCAHVSDAMKGRKRLARQKFPYRLPKGTRHYVMWYLSETCPVSREQVSADIAEGIRLLIGPRHDFEFVWYENPKMTVPELYHVQVFWRKLTK